jgi:WD40 repeat protein
VDKLRSPGFMSIGRDGTSVMFVEKGVAYSVDSSPVEVKSLNEKGEELLDSVWVKHGMVTAYLKPFKSQILDQSGTQRIRALVFATTTEGDLWLIANTAKASSFQIFEPATQKKLGKLKCSGKPRALIQARFSPDGKLLATVEGNGKITLRDSRTTKPVQKITEYAAKKYAMGVEFSPNGALLITGGRQRDGPGVLLWRRR